MLLMKDDAAGVEAALAAGHLAYPDCGGRLARWGFSTERQLRTLAGVRRLRPRRTLCSSCGVTHVLEPVSTVPRLRDTAEVVGTAWLANGAGAGHRVIAAQLDQPVSTVLRWLRRLAARAEALRAAATSWLYALDLDANPIEPTGSATADALEAVGPAATAVSRRFGPRPPWDNGCRPHRRPRGFNHVRPRRAGVQGGRRPSRSDRAQRDP